MFKIIATGLLSAAAWLFVFAGYWPGALSCFCCALVLALIPKSPRRNQP